MKIFESFEFVCVYENLLKTVYRTLVNTYYLKNLENPQTITQLKVNTYMFG